MGVKLNCTLYSNVPRFVRGVTDSNPDIMPNIQPKRLKYTERKKINKNDGLNVDDKKS